MKSRIINIIIAVVFIIGLFVLLYPSVSDYINQKHASKVSVEYVNTVKDTDKERIEQMFKDAETYNRTLAQTPSAFFDPSLIEGYEDALNLIDTGVMGQLTIKRLRIDLPIYHGISEGVLQVGAGHIEGTSLPVGGKNTHCVLSGHRGLPSAKLFTNLDRMELGDQFTITVLDRVMTYQVDQIKVVLPEQTDDLRITAGKDYCTLMTCTPYGVNSHRLLVRGIRVDNAEEKLPVYVTNEAFMVDTLIVIPIFAAPFLLALLIVMILYSRLRRKKRKAAEVSAAAAQPKKKPKKKRGKGV